MAGENEFVTISLSDLKALERLAVAEAEHKILAEDFQRHREVSESNLKDINVNISKIYDLTRAHGRQVNECKNEIENEMKDTYMSKTDGMLLEQHLANNIRSVKLWIVSSVGGFTTAGLLILWTLKLTGFHIDLN